MRIRACSRLPLRSIALLVAIVAMAMGAMLAPMGTALAQDIRDPSTLLVAVPEDVPLGERALLMAKLTSGDGQTIAGARLSFYSPATLGGVAGEMEIGTAVTDERGIAELVYQTRTQGYNEFTARFFGNERYQPSQASAMLNVTGVAQLYQPTSGVRLPVFGGWTIAAVLLGVWAVYFTALVVVSRIPRVRAGLKRTGGAR